MTEEDLSEKARVVMDQLWEKRGERELMPAERLAPEFFELASSGVPEYPTESVTPTRVD